ncbi:WD40-repeat-containing domain protein [Cunninghamella echinulata]|nr:WD40-repeat-containing domain protein [Cunninghamella echinulata]
MMMCSSVSPNQKILRVVGDTNETHILDATSNKAIYKMKDHQDFSFTCCFSPDGTTLATGNQDKTIMIYDIRQLSTPLHTLGANVGGVRSLHFSNDGKYLAMAESIDFVHIFQTSKYGKSQVIDFFGEISGVSFTPDDEA